MPKLSADDLANQAETLGFLPPEPPSADKEAEIAKELESLRKRAEQVMQQVQGQPWAQAPEPAEKTDPCPVCGGVGYFRRDVQVGHPDFGKPVPCRHTSHQEERANRLASLDQMTNRQRSLCLEDIIHYDEDDGSNTQALIGARQFLEKPAGTYFVYGPPGNGKTDILCALVNEFYLRTKVRGIYLSLYELLDFIRDAWAEKEALDRGDTDRAYANMGKQARWLAVVNAPIIAVDEFDIDPQKLNLTGWVREQLFRFVYDRHQREEEGQGWTILSSNNPPDQFAAPIRSRLLHSRNIVVKNTAPDMRSML